VSFAVQFDWQLFQQRLFSPDAAFWGALATTVVVAVVAQAIGIVLGLASALGSMAKRLPVRLLAGAYVLVVRGTPLIVQIFFIYFGANLFLGFDLFPRTLDAGLFAIGGAVMAGTVALSLNEGAYMSEIIRAAIGSVDKGQLEAAKACGMTYRMGMRRLVLPQAARVVIPPLGNEFNNMLKNTSLLAFIGVYEMFHDTQVHYSTDFKPVEYFAAVAIWYLLLTTVWSLVQMRLERRLGRSDAASGARARRGLPRLLRQRPLPEVAR
jgi:polar amino acid transport system permease protein